MSTHPVASPPVETMLTRSGSMTLAGSEPATCNRLTPALAQEIKAFLNHYKLEEMDVHPSSRV